MTLAVKDANSKLLHFVNVAEERVDESLIDILKLGFGRDFEP